MDKKAKNTELKDGDKFHLTEVVYVTGRKQYATAGGSTKTVLELELVDVDAVKKRAKEIVEETKKGVKK